MNTENMTDEYRELFEDKVILITGGTGFLGQALTREILKYNPKSIRVFSRDEVKHHKFQENFRHNQKLRNFIGDIRDRNRIIRAVEGADIVIHAAALKRLDILEYNVSESIHTNILGTLNIIDACLKNDVEKAIFISSDKACSPVNTYGACKFIGEKIFSESSFSKGVKRTIFSCVRYGNVLESTGSVIPFFESKIKKGEKIPLTSPEMTRFIISPEGAVKLVFDALVYSKGGEVFVPKIPAFKITDLINILKEKHNANNETEIIGLRPGEKIHELMVNEAEVTRTYEFKGMYLIKPSMRENYYSNIKKSFSFLDNYPPLSQQIEVYSSEDSVISKEEVCTLFNQLGLLNCEIINDKNKSVPEPEKVMSEANPISPSIQGRSTTNFDEQTPEYKEYRRKWEAYPKEHFYGNFPLHLDIELSNRCNLNCIMCPRRKMEREQGDMDLGLFKKIIDEGAEKGLCAVNLNLLGEPLLYPHLKEAIKYCKQKGLQDVHLHTNAFLLNETNARMLINSGLDSMKISLDAATKETYEKIRIGSNFDIVVENIKRLVQIRDELGLTKPKVKINFIEMRDTTEEIERAIEFWKPVVNQIAILRYIDFGVGENLSVYEVNKKENFCCPFLWQKLSVYWNGSIPICFRCSATKDNIIGDVNDISIEEIWKSGALKLFRERHIKGDYMSIPICAECHVPQEEMSRYIIGDKHKPKNN